jgi:hypothetical protein
MQTTQVSSSPRASAVPRKAAASFSVFRAGKGYFAQRYRNCLFFQDMKRPFRAILSSIFALLKTQKTTKRPFRARI